MESKESVLKYIYIYMRCLFVLRWNGFGTGGLGQVGLDGWVDGSRDCF